MSTSNRELQQRGERLAEAAREARQEAAAGLDAPAGGFAGERLAQETTGTGRAGGRLGARRAGSCRRRRLSEARRRSSAARSCATLARRPRPPSAAPHAGPYGTYAKGGSETGMLGGMGTAAAPPRPGAKPDVSARMAQVGCPLWV